MLRTTLAALAVTAILASASLAGDCATCGYGGGGYGSGGYAAASWDGYCGCGGNACNSCGSGCGCKRCCFPLLHCTLHKVGRVFDALLPDPCCRRSCGRAVGCAQPTCGIEPGCGAVGMPGDPFLDDHHSAPPTPTPAAEARTRNWSNAKAMSYPKPLPAPALKPTPMKTASKGKPSVKVASKPATTATGKSVLKVAYDEDQESGSSDESDDAPPAAPASIRRAVQTEIEQVRFTTPVARTHFAELPANPLRP